MLKKTQPWWSEQLSQLWTDLCQTESKWQKASRAGKAQLKAEMMQAQRCFDKETQSSAKRRYWSQNKEELMQLNAINPQEFWKKLGKVGLVAERKSAIPMEIIQDGVIKKDRVINGWVHAFSNLLHYERSSNENDDHNVRMNTRNNPLIDTGIENPMSLVSHTHFGEKELLIRSIKITLWIPVTP